MTDNYSSVQIPENEREKLFAVWLSDALKPASMYFKPLIEKYESFEKIYGLTEKEYKECGVPESSPVMRHLTDKSLESSRKIFGFCKHYYFGILIYTSEHYPKRLRLIKDPPPVLYVRGRWIDFNSNVCIAVVGTRTYSEQGWKSTYMISEGLAKCGAVVVTGLASGIDTAAASASLAASGMTVGVLGTGIERIYPSENKPLFEKMYTSGTIISELSPFASTSGAYFPVRNRIISGLCHGVLVGEGAQSSGAMITAAHAAEQGRHVFAIPGDISNPESEGVNRLINEGATPVFDAWNILEKYYYAYPHKITRLEKANGTEVPEARSSRRIRVLGSKRKRNPDEEAKRVSTEAESRESDEPTFEPSPAPNAYPLEDANTVVDTARVDAAEPRTEKPIKEKKRSRVKGQSKNPIGRLFGISGGKKADEDSTEENAKPQKSPDRLSETARTVYDFFSFDEPRSIDGAMMELRIPFGEVVSIISSLEADGLLENTDGRMKKAPIKQTEQKE